MAAGYAAASTSPRWVTASFMAGRTTTQPVLIDDEVPVAPGTLTCHSRPCTSPTTWRRSARSASDFRICRRSPVSTRRSIAATAPRPTTTPSPQRLYEEGVRRYGFHGLSYEYVASRLREIAPDIAKRRVIVAHLGSGASMCAMPGGTSVESTMGFTALDGLPMGTRPGQIDPGVVLYLIDREGDEPGGGPEISLLTTAG